jgi:hypothetical protein
MYKASNNYPTQISGQIQEMACRSPESGRFLFGTKMSKENGATMGLTSGLALQQIRCMPPNGYFLWRSHRK